MRGAGGLHDVVDAGGVEASVGEDDRAGVEEPGEGALPAGAQRPVRARAVPAAHRPRRGALGIHGEGRA